MKEVSNEVFQERCQGGRWEQMSNVDSFGKCEVRDCKSNRRFWVRVN